MSCPGPKCKLVLDEATIERVVEPKAMVKFRQSVVRAFVDDSENMRWCPAPNCDSVVDCAVRQSQLTLFIPSVRCKCNNRFCFGCASP